jgi:hypothetical protein
MIYIYISRDFKPTDTSLFFAGSVCEPGDYSGKNKNTEALASCVFEKSVGAQLAKELKVTVE